MRCSSRRMRGRRRTGTRPGACSTRSSVEWRGSFEMAVAVRRSPVRFKRLQQPKAHEYVAEQIRRHIALRLIAPGESLPSERELAAMFGVGRPTIQLAVKDLAADRLVESRRGRRGGTFVSEPAEDTIVLDEL